MEKTCDNCGFGPHCGLATVDCIEDGFKFWKPKETGIKEVLFSADHVGIYVYSNIYGYGKIYRFDNGDEYPVVVKFNKGNTEEYTKCGRYLKPDVARSLFVGRNVKITVEEDDLPEKLICPVCGVEHKICENSNISGSYYYFNTGNRCPFDGANYIEKKYAIEAMRNLIKAMS